MSVKQFGSGTEAVSGGHLSWPRVYLSGLMSLPPCPSTRVDPGILERRGGVFKGVGVHFADFISFLPKYLMKMN